jgi:hypothetical protein
VEVLLAGAGTAAPPPLTDLLEPDLISQAPADLADLLALLPKADVSLQDQVLFVFHPTLTRVWCRKGRRGQRLVAAPGQNAKVYGFGIVDWVDGWFDGQLAAGRTAAALCAQVRTAVARSQARGRVAIVLVDNLRTHTARGSKLVRQLLEELRGQLLLVYTPAYDPDANRIEWLWRISRRAVTHNHHRERWQEVQDDIERHFTLLAEQPNEVLHHIGSAFAEERVTTSAHALTA